jgi:hypothetical protein
LAVLADMAMRGGMVRVYFENGNSHRVAWIDEKEMVAMSGMIERVASRIVASDVTNILREQLRGATGHLLRAITMASGMPTRTSNITVTGPDTVVFGALLQGANASLGISVKYDYGSDTYAVTPILVTAKGRIEGDTSDDFYVEDFRDITKMRAILERAVKRGNLEREMMARAVDDTVIEERVDLFQAIMGKMSRIPGVVNVSMNDRSRTADEAEIFVELAVKERFSAGWPYEGRVREFVVDPGRVRMDLSKMLRVERDIGVRKIEQPIKLFRTTQVMRQRDTVFAGYSDTVIIVEIFATKL